MKTSLHRPAAALAVAGALSGAFAQTSVRASVADNEVQGNNYSPQASISPDVNGRYVVFTSAATNMVPGFGVTSNIQVFKRDLVANTTTIVSLDAFGMQANTDCANPKISADGRYVVFSSAASNLDLADTNGVLDVFVRDTLAGITTRASAADDESVPNDWSGSGFMSGDGNLVVFRSYASNLVAGGTSSSQVFMRNLSAGTTVLVSKEDGSTGAQGNDETYQPIVTPDGRYVCFASRATNLSPGDTNGSSDVFVRDMVLSTNRRISIAINGNQGWQDSYNSSISDDGRYVVFVSNQGFVSGDTNNVHDVFLRDIVANTITRVSVDSQGKQANGGASGGIGTAAGWGARISGDGTKIYFQSLATNLVKADNNGVEDIFVRNRLNNTTTMVSLNTAGKPANGYSGTPTVNYNVQYVAFISNASNIVSGDTNNGLDAFRRGAY